MIEIHSNISIQKISNYKINRTYPNFSKKSKIGFLTPKEQDLSPRYFTQNDQINIGALFIFIVIWKIIHIEHF